MINIREKIIDLIARTIEQWIELGDFKFGGYIIPRGEVIERLHLRGIETLVVADEVTKEIENETCK